MTNMNNLMMDAIFEVFEKMFYIFLEPLSADDRRGDLAVLIRFDGDPSGVVTMNLSQGMAVRMAQNMLGLEEEELQGEILQDCAKEALNMICGNFLRKIAPAGVFHLSIPEMGGAEAQGPGEIAGGASMGFLFDADGEWIGIDTIMKTMEITEDR